MRDRDIRLALRRRLEKEHEGEPDTLLLDELGLCTGTARIDLATVNGSLNGYEIKSERDTLQRLPHQIEVYNKILDTITIIVGEHHLKNVLDMVPEWWGVERAYFDCETLKFEAVRFSLKNTGVDAYALAQLLWRDEALCILKEVQLEKGMRGKPRKVLWNKLAEAFTVEELNSFVRSQLKARLNWRSDAQPSSDDD